ILWSDFQLVSFKRWFRLAGVVPIALVVLSERSPLKAMESVLRRCAYVLIPLSLSLIKYFPYYGVQYSNEGTKMWVGVASQKNSFGVICAISIFMIIWSFARELKEGGLFNKKIQTVSDALVCGIAIFNLLGFRGTYPATAIGFLICGIVALVFLNKQKNYKRQCAVIMLIVVITGLLSLTFFKSLVPIATSTFNRKENFTGRDEIWRLVMEEASKKPVLGYGFGAYWYLQDEKVYSQALVHEGHSGYLDVYLETGIVGSLFLLLFLLDTFKKSVRLINYSQFWGICGVCLIIMSVLHNYTESNYIRTSSYFWNIIVIISIIISSKRVHYLAT
ncbi:O-antigen ligase family protein, partial [bacterium]|nr:O-antigen ligase family protein [bacterium]